MSLCLRETTKSVIEGTGANGLRLIAVASPVVCRYALAGLEISKMQGQSQGRLYRELCQLCGVARLWGGTSRQNKF